MRSIKVGLTALLLFLGLIDVAMAGAQRRSTHSSSRPRSSSVNVRSYTTKSGKTVPPHTRSAPRRGTAKSTPVRAVRPTRSVTTGPRRTATSPRTTSRAPVIRQASSPRSTACATCARDSKGRIARSATAKQSFMKSTGYPKGRPGYVVDHKIPLACGGADSPSNMQWQTVAEAKAKDKVERKGCR